MLEAVALGIGLAMDATALAAVRGLAGHERERVLLPVLFAVFQAGMAALGWGLGAWGGPYVEAWDHWIASGLLFAIGGKLLLDARRAARTPPPAPDTAAPAPAHVPAPASALVLFGLSLATSIDAAAAGLTLPLLPVAPLAAIAIIGVVTFACSAAGFAAGRRVGRRLEGRLAALGGILLIAIGVRVLVQHL